MLIVSDSYNFISDIMNEDRYNYGRGLTADQAKAELHKESSDPRLDSLVDILYDLWGDKFHSAYRSIPLRFPEDINRKVKIAREYKPFLKDNSKIPFHISDDKFKIDNIEFSFGDGTVFSDRTAAGLEYEKSAASEVKSLLLEGKIAQNESELNRLHKKYKDLIDDDNFKAAKDKATVDNIDQLVTVKKPSRRNSNQQLWDNQFNINIKNARETISESAYLLSDVIIHSGPLADSIYLSAKIESHQWSAPSCSCVFEKNITFRKAADSELPFNKSGLNKDTAFCNFCNLFCLNKKDLYSAIVPHNENDRNTLKVKTQTSESKDNLGALFQMIIGGGYYLVKRGNTQVKYITKDFKKAKFVLDSNVLITDSGKTITFTGKFNGVNAKINVRTSSGEAYPNRIFPVIDHTSLIEALSKNK